ncbi:uncharacterized protein LOC134532366 [Bacillus rossius redtenbacheri]|uniref:uncharacterized protein LOC134532366 n=1 Tax=Bacillus rossius redtenbacheri TaxID=93214 RepID=UPI002FDE70A6
MNCHPLVAALCIAVISTLITITVADDAQFAACSEMYNSNLTADQFRANHTPIILSLDPNNNQSNCALICYGAALGVINKNGKIDLDALDDFNHRYISQPECVPYKQDVECADRANHLETSHCDWVKNYIECFQNYSAC